MKVFYSLAYIFHPVLFDLALFLSLDSLGLSLCLLFTELYVPHCWCRIEPAESGLSKGFGGSPRQGERGIRIREMRNGKWGDVTLICCTADGLNFKYIFWLFQGLAAIWTGDMIWFGAANLLKDSPAQFGALTYVLPQVGQVIWSEGFCAGGGGAISSPLASAACASLA